MNKLEQALNFTKKTLENTLGYVRPTLEKTLNFSESAKNFVFGTQQDASNAYNQAQPTTVQGKDLPVRLTPRGIVTNIGGKYSSVDPFGAIGSMENVAKQGLQKLGNKLVKGTKTYQTISDYTKISEAGDRLAEKLNFKEPINPLNFKTAEDYVKKYEPISQFTEDGKTGKFWTTPEGADEGFGSIKKNAYIDTTKLYQGESSLDFIKERKLLTPQIKKKIETAWETSDPNMEFKIPQDIAESVLKKEGYSGANWKYEDDLNPTQYQIWDKSIIKDKSQLISEWNKAHR